MIDAEYVHVITPARTDDDGNILDEEVTAHLVVLPPFTSWWRLQQGDRVINPKARVKRVGVRTTMNSTDRRTTPMYQLGSVPVTPELADQLRTIAHKRAAQATERWKTQQERKDRIAHWRYLVIGGAGRVITSLLILITLALAIGAAVTVLDWFVLGGQENHQVTVICDDELDDLDLTVSEGEKIERFRDEAGHWCLERTEVVRQSQVQNWPMWLAISAYITVVLVAMAWTGAFIIGSWWSFVNIWDQFTGNQRYYL